MGSGQFVVRSSQFAVRTGHWALGTEQWAQLPESLETIVVSSLAAARTVRMHRCGDDFDGAAVSQSNTAGLDGPFRE